MTSTCARIRLFSLFWVLSASQLCAQDTAFQVLAPYGDTQLSLRHAGDKLTLAIQHRGQAVLFPSLLDLRWTQGDGQVHRPGELSSVVRREVDTLCATPYYRKPQLRDYYRELTLTFADSMTLRVRAYAYGVAYRWELSAEDSVDILDERMALTLPPEAQAWTRPSESIQSFDRQQPWGSYSLDLWPQEHPEQVVSQPTLVRARTRATLLLGSAAQRHYPVPFFQVSRDSLLHLETQFARRSGSLTRSEARVPAGQPLARWAAGEPLPWRVFIMSEQESSFYNEDLIYLLNPAPDSPQDYQWVQPGAALWPAGNGYNLFGVDFRTGANYETYQAYLDFAASQQLPYVVIDSVYEAVDEAYYQPRSALDLDRLAQRAHEQGVRLIARLDAEALRPNPSLILDQLAFWDIAGVWVQRIEGQTTASRRWQARLIEQCARAQLLLILDDGAFSDGSARHSPHVMGLGAAPHATGARPDQDLAWAATHLATGPVAYASAAMEHAGGAAFQPRTVRPVSAGTRCRQLAQMVIYDAPLRPWLGMPKQYLREPAMLRLYREIPLRWDRIIAQQGDLEGPVVVAKRKGQSWWVAVLNGDAPRQVQLDLDFLPEGRYQATWVTDGINADRIGEEYRMRTDYIDRTLHPRLSVAAGGGALLVVRPAQ